MMPFQLTHSLSWHTSFQQNTTEHFPFQKISLSTVGYQRDMSDWWLVFCVTEQSLRPIVTLQKALEFHSSISSHHLNNHSQYCVYLPSIYGLRGTRNVEFHTRMHKLRLINTSLESSLSRVQWASMANMDYKRHGAQETVFCALAARPKRCQSVCWSAGLSISPTLWSRARYLKLDLMKSGVATHGSQRMILNRLLIPDL